MEWLDQGYVLAAKRHGEGDAIVSILTREHGRHLGLVKGGLSRMKRPWVEPGNLVSASWRARLSEQLGHFQLEPVRATAAMFLDDPVRLAALSAICATIEAALPEREPHTELFGATSALLQIMEDGSKVWPTEYVRWEGRLLSELGFGLDLSRCALTGATEDLAYVSPRTGRAATRSAVKGLQEKLLPLPSFLTNDSIPATDEDLLAGLRLMGHFLRIHVFEHSPRKGLIEARDRMLVLLSRNVL